MFLNINLKKVVRPHYLIFLCFAYYAIILVKYAWPYSVDDAYITLRYAKNLHEYGALIWNQHGPAIEGYSNFIYVLLGALFIHLKLSPIILLKLFSTLSLIISLSGIYLISRLWLNRTFSLLAPLIVLMHPGEIIWTVSGLETAFFQAVVVFSCYLLLKNFYLERKTYHRTFAASGFLMAISALTRPEGPMLFLCFFLLLLYLQLPQKKSKLIAYTLGFCSLYLPYFIWHYAYFGRLFPNPVYCKALNAPSWPFALDYSYLVIVLPLLSFSLRYIKSYFEKRHLFLIVPSIAYLIALTNADWIVGFLDRHFLLAYALISPFIVCGLVTFIEKLNVFNSGNRVSLATVIFTIIAGYLFAGHQYTPYHYGYLANSGHEGNTLRMRVSNWLNQHVKRSETISVGDCGIIPFYFKGNVIDTYCLNSLAMTTRPINLSYARFNQYLMQQAQPDYVILLALVTRHKRYFPPSDLKLLSDPLFEANYMKVKHFSMGDINSAGYFYDIYRRKAINKPVRL